MARIWEQSVGWIAQHKIASKVSRKVDQRLNFGEHILTKAEFRLKSVTSISASSYCNRIVILNKRFIKVVIPRIVVTRVWRIRIDYRRCQSLLAEVPQQRECVATT